MSDLPAYRRPSQQWDGVAQGLQQNRRQAESQCATMPTDRSLTTFHWSSESSPPLDDLIEALSRDGAVIIHNAAHPSTCDAVWEEMAPFVKQSTTATYGAPGAVLTRPGCVLARSKASWDLAMHPLVLELCDGVLGRQVLTHPTALECAAQFFTERGLQQHPYQLDLTKMVAVGPGSDAQDLHQDAGKHLVDLRPLGLEVSVSLVWALDDFTTAAGATRICPGSHMWYFTDGPSARPPTGETGVAAEMPAGSLLFMLGYVWHGAGPNTTNQTRKGLTIDYSLAYMRQEENMYLAVPPAVALAMQMPERLLKLIGYEPAGHSMGYVDDGDSPLAVIAKL